uniref:Uncharacterized protein n=1 Tax=Caenorhabditis japonica TaxID=281687 RepID=A0A8R1HYG3_CAEJA
MSQNRAPRDDPYQPSTSTASQRRYDANRREFERIFSPQTPPNLWQILTTRQRGRALKANFEAEIRALRGLNFSVLLKPYESYLTDLCQVCSTTFPDLCQQLRHFAFYKRMPCTNDDEDAKDLFQMVATCIHYENMQWKAIIRKRTLLDKITERRLKHTRLKTEEPQPATSTASTIFKILKKSRRVPFNPMDDEHLREQHYLDDVGSSDHKFVQTVDKFMKSVIRNNMANRTKECALSDVEYYCVDDRVLLAPQISFRLDNMLQIVEFKLPAIEDDGYFPPDRPDRAWYLFEQYQKAHFECTSAFSVLRPPNGLPIAGGFERSTIVAQELLYFHSLGRHIHGFHEVWRETERGFQQKDGQWVPRRYLVDIYNQVKFPMYIEWEMWPPQLKWAFDKLSLYSLKLMYMVKKYSRELKSLGDSLFTRYPSAIHEGMKFSIASVKGRQQYLSVISEQNMRINEKCALLPGSTSGKEYLTWGPGQNSEQNPAKLFVDLCKENTIFLKFSVPSFKTAEFLKKIVQKDLQPLR